MMAKHKPVFCSGGFSANVGKPASDPKTIMHRKPLEQRIGFCFMGTYSKLHNTTYQEIHKHFPEWAIRENYRPDWLMSSKLTRLELDLYIEQIKTGVEIQGIQHYEYNSHFHKTYQDFLNQKQRDQEKRDLCAGNDIRLIEIASSIDLSLFIQELLEQPDEQEAKKLKPRKSLMRSKSFRARARKCWRKWQLRRQGLLPPPPKYANLIMPGSRVQRHYAKKILRCEQIDNETWKVWGGQNEHLVKNWQCDCWQATTNKKICSHIIRIMMETTDVPFFQRAQTAQVVRFIFPKQGKLVTKAASGIVPG